MPRYVTEAEVAELLAPADARVAVHASLGRLARGVVDNPSRVRAELPGGVFAVMPCVDRELGYAGLKTYAWLPGGTPFLVVLFSIERAELTAVVEADLLGQRRTAAASAVAAQLLARDGAATLGVIGCGRQAAAHVVALREVLPSLTRVVVYGPNADRVAAFSAQHGCEAGDAREAGACDVVVTVTTSREPVLRGEWLRPGALVLGIGANDPAYRELDDAVLERAAFVCTDSRAQAREEAGDLIGAGLDWADVAELQDVVTGKLTARGSDDEIIVFKSNGLAAWDIAAAARVVELLAG
jgi:ornithine cyclodeaminase/alanine dehydrogenase-like protein (mu-crystallin family)